MVHASVCAYLSTCLSIHLEIIMGNRSWSGNTRGFICDPAVMQLYQCHRDGADLCQCGVREQSLSAPRAAGVVKSHPEAFLLCCFRSLPWVTSPSSSSRTWMWQLLRLGISGRGEQLVEGLCWQKTQLKAHESGWIPSTVSFLSWNLTAKHNRGSWVCC